MSERVIIIGGVAGGATTAARLRRLDENIEIIVLEKGDYISYANCGLPYYIGDVIKQRESLLLQTPEAMKKKFNIDVRTGNEAIEIDTKNKVVKVKNVKDDSITEESYDRLVISTGSSPIVPPIEGINGEGIFTLWNIPDTDRIKKYVENKKPRTAAVIGGGFIGLEMTENLSEAGCKVSIIEMQNQVMAPLDFEMAEIVHENIESNNTELILSDGVKKFEGNKIVLSSGRVVEADIIILAIGIRPNSSLAKAAGLELNERGGIKVNEYLKTSDENIYAVGDVIEVEEFVEKGKTMIPLAGPANKQARICANNIAKELGANSGETMGIKGSATENIAEAYKGTQGTSVAKIFDLTVSTTGLNEKNLIRMGKELNKDYFVAIINQKSHAGYYPDATQIMLKLIFSDKGKILGAQAVGQDGVDKRIDVIATAMRFGANVLDLNELELAYAPPYSSAKDPVNMLGFVAENMLKGKVTFTKWDDLEDRAALADKYGVSKVTVLDVTEEFERMAFSIEDSVHIPLGQIRNRIKELDKNDLIVVYCAVGVRSYNAARILANNGYKNVAVYPGGTAFYKTLFRKRIYNVTPKGEIPKISFAQNVQNIIEEQTGNIVGGSEMDVNNIVITKNLDCSGLQCPGPIMKVFNAINEIEEGQIIKVSATDMGFIKDVESWCKRTGNTLVKNCREGKQNIAYIQKGLNNKDFVISQNCTENGLTMGAELPQGKTLIVFSGDLDKVLASFIIANGAAAMGRPVTMFFTFWGLNALRKAEKQKVKKPVMDSMFGMMMPRGTSKLKLSKMNMGGMGTQMMKKVMNDKNVDSLEDLMKNAMSNGVKLVACTMSMDVMGIKKEELIDGIEYAGVAAYLGDAEQSNVNLFI